MDNYDCYVSKLHANSVFNICFDQQIGAPGFIETSVSTEIFHLSWTPVLTCRVGAANCFYT